MSNVLAIPDLARQMRNEGYIAFLALGTDPASLELYSTTRPGTPGGDAGGAPCVVILLANPPGTIVDSRIRLDMLAPEGYMISTGGDILWGRLKNGNGDWAGDGDVTDSTGEGVFRLAGTGIHLYAGGYALLASNNRIG